MKTGGHNERKSERVLPKRTFTPRDNTSYMPVIDFQTVCFYDLKAERQVVLIYALGQDGIVREFTGSDNWKAFPIRT
jgi:hypothetical protein